MKEGNAQPPGGSRCTRQCAVGLALLAWLIPGAGHYSLGHRNRGILFCVAICGMVLVGLIFGQYTVISWEGHRLAMLLQVFAGLPTLLTAGYAHMDSTFPPTLEASPYVDLGMALTLVAGALNALLVSDVYYRATGGTGRTDKTEEG